MKKIRYTRTAEGFEAWLENNQNFLRWMIRKYYSGQIDHEDVYQEACIAAWNGYMSYDTSLGVKLTSYIGKCVQNAIWGLYREESALKRPQALSIGLAVEFEDIAADYVLYEDDYEIREDIRVLLKAICTLPDTERAIILMTAYGVTQVEIAQALGCCQATVSMTLKDVRATIKEKIA